jgi:hypothetical protein
VRPAAPVAELKTLRDVVRAHIALDKGKRERSDGGAAGDLKWWPTVFIVIVRKDWREKVGGLLFVLRMNRESMSWISSSSSCRTHT